VNGEMSKETEKMTARMLAAVLAAAVCLLAAAPGVLAAAPAFKLTTTSQPTNFIAGSDIVETGGLQEVKPQYSVIATNVGSAPTSGPVTFTDTLPDDLTPVGPLARDRSHTAVAGASQISCGVVDRTVTCTDPFPLQPGEWFKAWIPVKVAADAPASVTNQASIVGGGAAEASTSTTTTVSSALPTFFDFLPGSNGFSLAATDADGQPATQAGSHPYGLTVDLGFPSAQLPGGSKASVYSAGHPRDIKATLPRGMVGNPNAIPVQCTEVQLESSAPAAKGGCPDASQAGSVTALTEIGGGVGVFPVASPLYNMVPPPGVAAEFGFDAAGVGIYVHLMAGVNSAGEYEIVSESNDVLAKALNPILGVQAQLWGSPSDPSHDPTRGECSVAPSSSCSTPVERLDIPFLTMPSSCRPSLTATAVADSWENPAQKMERSAEVEDPSNGDPTSTDGCNQLDFSPTIEAKPTTNLSDAPTGLDFKLHNPQTEKFEELSTANFKDVKVTFPEGMTVNPSGANGLGACSAAQFGLTSGVGQAPVRADEAPANCPDNAKIGTVEVSTPLLDHPVSGALYVAQPYENPFGSLLAIYLAVDDPQTGVVSKLAGEVEADPSTGQLTTTFKDNPELPIEDVTLKVFGGPRAALKTPLACGAHTIVSDITPWSTPEGADEHPSDSFQTSVAAAGSGVCPTSEAAAPNTPSFNAGTIAPQAGAYSPFVFKLSRADGTQRLTAIDTTLPKGLIGKLAGTTYCSEAQIAQAKSREAPNQGALEQASPSCPLSSEVGSVTVGAGAGITPYYVQGHAYLAGPYKGAPLSFLFITPVVAGPYDLGSVVARAAVYFNSETAQVHVVSDPLPTILEGVPADIRSIAVKVDRPNFTLNPTSCDPMAVLGQATAATGQIAPLSNPFQVGGCSALKFKPKLALSLKGGTKRTKHPALKAVLTYPQGAYANTAYAQVTLPHSAFLDTTHIGTICTRVQFAADACPAASIYGFARATTPLLDNPLEGPVYLRSSSHKLPDLVLALDGQVDVDAVGRVDTGKAGGIRTTFEAIPDAPISKVVLEMKGGKKGLFVNSENLCSKPQKAIADFRAQNGKISDTTPLIANSCKGKAKKKHKKHKAKKSKPSKARR
jgi:hypothetical protein